MKWPYKIYWIGKCPYVWKKSILLDTLYLVEYTTEIFESWSFIANTTGKKVLSLNEYSKVFYQNPQSELFKVWMAFRCVDTWQRSLRDTTAKKFLSLNEYSNVFYKNPQSEIFKVWMAFRCADRYLWELKLYCKDIGPGKFAKKHKCRALNKRRASEF